MEVKLKVNICVELWNDRFFYTFIKTGQTSTDTVQYVCINIAAAARYVSSSAVIYIHGDNAK